MITSRLARPREETARARHPCKGPGPVVPARALLGRGARLLGAGGRLAGVQRRDRGQRVLSELPLRREQLLGEVVGTRHDLRRLRQLVGEWNVQVGQRGLDGLDGVGPRLNGVDDGLLALANGLQDLVLEFLRAGGDGHGSSSCLLQTIVSKLALDVKRAFDISSAVAGRQGRWRQNGAVGSAARLVSSAAGVVSSTAGAVGSVGGRMRARVSRGCSYRVR